MKKYMLSNLPVLKMTRSSTMCTSWRRHCMAWSKHLEHGMRGWGTSYSLKGSDGQGWHHSFHQKDWQGLVCVANICWWHHIWINQSRFCDEFGKMMANEFERSMIGELSYFLGLQIKQLKNGTFLSQDKYIKYMLKKFWMDDAKSISTPKGTNGNLDSDAS